MRTIYVLHSGRDYVIDRLSWGDDAEGVRLYLRAHTGLQCEFNMPHGCHAPDPLIPGQQRNDAILRGHKSDRLPLIKHKLRRRLMTGPPEF